jgi:hypothetical protein
VSSLYHNLLVIPSLGLRSTQPRTETSTRILPGGKGRPERKADNLTAMREPTVSKIRSLYVSQPYNLSSIPLCSVGDVSGADFAADIRR